MTEDRAAPLLGGVALLERAINYTRGSLMLVTPGAMARATPCREWDLAALLWHLNDSLETLYEAADMGRVRMSPCDVDGDPVAALRDRACRLLGAWTSDDGCGMVSIGARSLSGPIVTSAGAVEVAVHGWDVARACGQQRPIPVGLAEEMLPLVPLFVGEADRPSRFAPAVDVSSMAPAGDQLVAFLGRDPG